MATGSYSEYIQQLKPSDVLEDATRCLLRQSLDCANAGGEHLAKECGVFRAEVTKPEWQAEAGNPYQAHTWKKYHVGNNDYDLVVYRRPRRSLLRKILCCGQ